MRPGELTESRQEQEKKCPRTCWRPESMLLLGVGYLGLFGLWLIRGVVSGGCSSTHGGGVCLVSNVRLTLPESSLELEERAGGEPM